MVLWPYGGDTVFQIGDRVVYPMHGAGIIEAIEEQEVLGEKQQYYIMRIPVGDLRVMVPLLGVEEIGLRQVIDQDGVRRVLEILRGESSTMSQNWNRRYRANMDKIRTGDVFELAEVVRNLALRDREKGLSTGERRMLDNAKQILVSELVLAQDQSPEHVLAMLEELLA